VLRAVIKRSDTDEPVRELMIFVTYQATGD